MNKKKLLICIPYLTPTIGGGAFVFFNILKYLNEKFDLHVVYFQKESEEYISEGINKFFFKKRTGSFWFYMEYLKLMIKAVLLLVRLRPEVVIANSYQPYMLFLIARFLSFSRGKIITAEHNNPETMFKSRPVRKFLVKIFDKAADLVIVPSEGVSRAIISDLGIKPEKITVIPNPVLTDETSVLAGEEVEEWIKKRDFKLIITVGTLNLQKNPFLLLKAFRIFRKKVKAKCLFIGDGPLAKELKDLVREQGMEEDVFFLGFRKNPLKYMKNSDIFVLPSDYEAFGNVIVEAMACGCPVVSTDCDYGPREIIENGVNGLLTKPNNENEMAEKLILLMSDEKLRKRLIFNANKSAAVFSAEEAAKAYIQKIGGMCA